MRRSRAVLEGDAELGVCSLPLEQNPQLHHETIGRETLLSCISPGHPLGSLAQTDPDGHPCLDPTGIGTEPLLLAASSREQADRLLCSLGLSDSRALVLGSRESVLALASEGFGVGLLPDTCLQDLRSRQNELPVEVYALRGGPAVTEYAALTRKGSYLPVCAADCIELMRKRYILYFNVKTPVPLSHFSIIPYQELPGSYLYYSMDFKVFNRLPGESGK